MKQKYSTSACVQGLSPTDADTYRISLFWSVKVFDCLTGDSRTWLLGSTWLSCFFIEEAEQLLPRPEQGDCHTPDSWHGDSAAIHSLLVPILLWSLALTDTDNAMQCNVSIRDSTKNISYETPQKTYIFNIINEKWINYTDALQLAVGLRMKSKIEPLTRNEIADWLSMKNVVFAEPSVFAATERDLWGSKTAASFKCGAGVVLTQNPLLISDQQKRPFILYKYKILSLWAKANMCFFNICFFYYAQNKLSFI